MFRLATCNDLIMLKVKYRNHWHDGANGWGLKQMGLLYCIDLIEHFAPRKVCEAGAGLSIAFDQYLQNKAEYWMIDRAGHYDQSIYAEQCSKRTHTTYVDALLGEQSEMVPQDYFDMTFSISVLEHVPRDKTEQACQDLYRITKPGGLNRPHPGFKLSQLKNHRFRICSLPAELRLCFQPEAGY